MGKKRQRSSAECKNGVDPKPSVASSATTQPFKKHKKAPLQLKVIAMKGAATPQKPKRHAPAPSATKSTASDEKETQSSQSKKKKKNKNNQGSAASESMAKPDSDAKTASTEDIDDLFQTLKTKKQQSAQAAEQQKLAEAMSRKQQKKEREQLEEQIKKLESQNKNFTAVQGRNPDPRPVRYDADGLPIYKEDHLMINQGGDTDDCPFDCWCCF